MSDIKTEPKAAKFFLDIENINREFRAIALSNNWQAYHNPKNLAAAVSIEANELLAEFQWLTAEESCALSTVQKSKVADEIADVIMYLTELSARLNIDIVDAVNIKIEKNKQRFKRA
jgi:NTP pyrophosphatase (non-canonical NTP hydrolase)